jgi:tripartite-type tricarboxylate transporter receptor subunit TctC
MSRVYVSLRKLIAFAGMAAALPAFAQSTGQPMRLILPVGPGSGVDTIVRVFSNALSRELGQRVVIENQPFDPIEDITPIMVIGETPFVLAAQ